MLQFPFTQRCDQLWHMDATDSACVSRRELDAFTALRMLAFPVPPLPLLATRGDECSDAVASSTDLMSRAIQLQYLHGYAGSNAEDVAQQVTRAMREKEELCVSMFKDVSVIWLQKPPGCDDEAVQKCYSVFQDTFRKYMSHYPGSPDLRFKGMSEVHRETLVHTQAVDFLRRFSSNVENSGITSTKLVDCERQTYTQVLRCYIEELCEMYKVEES